MSKELAIGQIGVIAGVKVECVKAESLACCRCAFRHFKKDDEWCCEVHKCTSVDRSDHTDVYFKKVD